MCKFEGRVIFLKRDIQPRDISAKVPINSIQKSTHHVATSEATSEAISAATYAVTIEAISEATSYRDANFEQQVGVMISVTPSRRRLT